MRGSAFRPEPRRITQREIRYLMEKAEIKIPARELPTDYSAYPRWRFKLLNRIRGCGLPAGTLNPYITELKTLTLEQLKARYPTLSETTLNLESKLFTSLLDSCSETKHGRHLTEIENKANEGAGREALKILDGLFLFNAENTLLDAADEFEEASCKSIASLGDMLTHLEKNLDRLEAGGQPVNEYILLAKLKRMPRPYKPDGITELSATYAEFEARPPHKRTVRKLLQLLQRRYDEWAKEQEKNKKLHAKAGVTGSSSSSDSKPICPVCKKIGHTEETCWTKHPEL